MILGVDVGGTFTDFVMWDGSTMSTAKVPTTVAQDSGVIAGARRLAAGRHLDRLLHGTTVATNALLEGGGARTALVTTAGFSDVVEIGRQDRPSLYDPEASRPPPLVPATLRFEVDERVTATGRVLAPPRGVDEVVSAVAAAAPEAVAVSLLGSFARPEHEDMVATALEVLRVPVSRSAEVVGEFREYERTATTVLNAYLTPIVAGYLDRLAGATGEGGVVEQIAVMRSAGGLINAAAAVGRAASLLLSGPAGGVMAAAALAQAHGRRRVVSFDMGGTSTDVCRIEGGEPQVDYERAVGGYPCRMPALAVHTVGAGGGSLAWVDAGTALRVGPGSAGAIPGPVCYGLGGANPTVSDAHLILGHLDEASPLGGTLHLDPVPAAAALRHLGEAVGMDAAAVSAGIVDVVEAHMANAIRRVSIAEGVDPRGATLVAFGGAGGLHASALARSLGMAGVLVPSHAGVFSALGLLLSPTRADAARTVLLDPDDGAVALAAAEVADLAATELRNVAGSKADVACRLDMRYVGQSHETAVRYTPGEPSRVVVDRFAEEHLKRNGFVRSADPIEVVTVRAEATGAPATTWDRLPGHDPVGIPGRGVRAVHTDDGWVDAKVWWRPALAPGAEVTGPAVVEEPEATTRLAPGERAVVHPSGALEVEW